MDKSNCCSKRGRRRLCAVHKSEGLDTSDRCAEQDPRQCNFLAVTASEVCQESLLTQLLRRSIYGQVRLMLESEPRLQSESATYAAVKLMKELVTQHDAGVSLVVLSAPFVASNPAIQHSLMNATYRALAELRQLKESAQLMETMGLNLMTRLTFHMLMAGCGHEDDLPIHTQTMRDLASQVQDPISRLQGLIMICMVSASQEDLARIRTGSEFKLLQSLLEAGQSHPLLFQAIFTYALLVEDPGVAAIGIEYLERAKEEDRAESETSLWDAIRNWEFQHLDTLSTYIAGSRYWSQVQRLAKAARNPSKPS